mgnify:CR=1 FL=1
MSTSGYRTKRTGFIIGTGFEQYDDLYFRPRFRTTYEQLTTNSTASKNLKKQEGSYFDSSFGYGLTLDKRNSAYQPTSGFYSSWYQQLPIVSENQTIVNGYIITGYKELVDDMIISTGI